MARPGEKPRTAKPRGRRDGASMFEHLGITLSLLRSLTGKSQAQAAQESGLGKSRLSKYESGKEMPKLDSLGRLLQALGATYLDFAYTLALVQQRAARPVADTPGAESGDLALLSVGPGLPVKAVDEAMRALMGDLLLLHRRCIETVLFQQKTPDKERP